MENFIETTGKTIEDAINIALSQLKMERDAVSVEVLEKPKSGFLGLGGTPAKIRVSFSINRSDRVTAFLAELFIKMGSIASIKLTTLQDGTLSYDITGENMGQIIGRRGDTLESIQHLANFVCNKGEEEHVRVLVDTENYRAKREESLIGLAHRTAEKAIKFRRNMTLEPMNAYARHVIHAALQDTKEISTFSTGNDPNRRVVVCFGERKPKTNNFNKPKKV